MKDAGKPLRLFFACMPERDAALYIAAASQRLVLSPATRVPPANFHMTVAFIGEVGADQLERVREIAARQRGRPFVARFDRYEYWPKPEVIVAAASEVPAELQQLWEDLHRDLAVHGWAQRPKRLRPHVTLARLVRAEPQLPAELNVHWPVSAFSLLRSELGEGGPRYTVLGTWPLLDSVHPP